MAPVKKSTMLLIALTTSLVLALILAGCDISRDNTPTPTNVRTSTPTPKPAATPTPADHPGSDDEGHQLFINAGCAACHGQNAEGTSIAPGLAGHTAIMIERQVRSPVGAMPAFSISTLSDEELDLIIEFIEDLDGDHAHVPPADIDQEVALHHWMALLAIQVDDIPEAIHHVGHIIKLVTGEHLHQMEDVLILLEEGQIHDAEHIIEGMLAGTAVLDLTPEVMHLQLALASLGAEDTTEAIHHTQHFLDIAEARQRDIAQEILNLIRAENFSEAEHELEELLEGASSPTPPAPGIGSGIEGGDPDFDFTAMVWQSYWLSRNHFGPFVMASGMGIPFQPPMDRMQMAIQMVGQNPEDPVIVPQNMAPLRAVFSSASPNLVHDPRDFSPMDFEAFRLDPATFDQTITVRGQAQTMLKESQWAHVFANPFFGTPDGDFGAQQRFIGMMVNMLAQMQGQYAMENLMSEDGLYRDSDGTLDHTGNWLMLHALSDIAGLTGDMNGRYMDPILHPTFDGAATMLFQALRGREPQSPSEAAAAIRGLTYRAWTATNNGVRDEAMAKAKTIADGQLLEFSSGDVVESSAAIVGLTSISSATGDSHYMDAADTLFKALVDDFDARHGVFNSKARYSVDDVAWILGGLNSLVLKGNHEIREQAQAMMVAFYESTLSLAGMQLSAPPGKDGAMASDWEKNLPSVLYYHPANTPPPPIAGKLPVPAAEIMWDGTAWELTSDRFVPVGAMHLANELNWIASFLGSIPFPSLGDQSS